MEKDLLKIESGANKKRRSKYDDINNGGTADIVMK